MGRRPSVLEGTFGRLTVKKRDTKDRFGNWVWICECSCGSGKIVKVRGADVRRGHVTSCGCLRGLKGGSKAMMPRNAEIRKEKARGVPTREICKKYGISRQRVHQITKGIKVEAQVS